MIFSLFVSPTTRIGRELFFSSCQQMHNVVTTLATYHGMAIFRNVRAQIFAYRESETLQSTAGRLFISHISSKGVLHDHLRLDDA